jgi:hypothetical protein
MQQQPLFPQEKLFILQRNAKISSQSKAMNFTVQSINQINPFLTV